MKRSNIRKWLLYFTIVFAVLSSFVSVSSGKDAIGYGKAGMVPAKITAPQSVRPIDYNLPENRIRIGMNGSGSSVAVREEDAERHRLFCFWVQVFLLLLFLHYIYQAVIRQFDRYHVKLWHDILYIHKSDGKKKMAFCNE